MHSDGRRIRALWRTPDATLGTIGAVVQGPVGSATAGAPRPAKDTAAYVPYHEALTDAGFGVLVIDYRGFGDSATRWIAAPSERSEPETPMATTWCS